MPRRPGEYFGSSRYYRHVKAVYRRDGYVCRACGELDRRRLVIDHIMPRVLGGSVSDLSNMQVLCILCNLVKGGELMTLEQIRARAALNRPTPKTHRKEPRWRSITWGR